MGKNANTKGTLPEFRAPVVTIMGHVDHGKTTLLDYIRKTNIADREFGGITQHVRSYQIQHDGRPITFIDTPGHEAFFAMRERGAKITDIIVLVVAADDGVMPQTKEVISLWKKINTHLIVAINKIDMPGANLDKVKRELAQNDVLIEGYGGDIPAVEVSAKEGTNVPKLLDLINAVAELSELDKYSDLSNVDFISESIVLESHLDKSIGPVARVIVKGGTVNQGDYAVGGKIYGKIRAVIDDQNKTIVEAYESMPISIIGIPKVLEVGEFVRTYANEDQAREASKVSINEEKGEIKEQFNRNMLANLFASQEHESEVKKLNIIIVADANGSLEAISHALKKLDIPDTQLNILEERTGVVTANDVNLGATRGGIILAFNTKIDNNAQKAAKEEKVLIREYKIIYELLEEIEGALIGLVEPTSEEEIFGEGEVRQVFQLTNGEFVAGCRVTKGKIFKGYQVFILRKGERIHDAKIDSLKHLKNEVKEANVGTECGVVMKPAFECQTGDTVICYKVKKLGF
jgi:translation initiation factor IF-2